MQTVELVEGNIEFDLAGAIQVLFSIAMAVAVGVLVFIGCSPSNSAKLLGVAKGGKAVEKERPEDNDWVSEASCIC